MLSVPNMEPVTIAEKVVQFFTMHDQDKRVLYSTWDEIDQYRHATDANQTLNVKGGFNHSTHLPDILTIGNTLEALFENTLFPSATWFEWQPYEAEAASLDVRKAISAYTKHLHELADTGSEYSKLIADFIYRGNAFTHTFYVDSQSFTGSKTIRIAPEDIVFNPAEPSFDSADKVIRRNVPEGEFAGFLEDPRFNTEAVKDILEDRKSSRERSSFGSNKDRQYTPIGFQTYDSYVMEGFVEVLWFYGDVYCQDSFTRKQRQVIVVADGEVIMWQDDDLVSGRSPFCHVPYHKRENNLWGMSPIEPLIGLNYMRNHRENAKSDALDRMVDPDLIFQGDVEPVYDDESGKVTYLAPEGGGVAELQISQQIAAFNPELDRLKQEMLVASGLPQEFMGFRTAGEKTLGEVTSLADGAMRGFIHKARAFERLLLSPSMNMELELERKYMRGIINAPYAQPDGVIEFLEIGEDKLSKNGVIKAVGASRYARNLKVLSTLTNLSNTPLFQLAQGDVDPHAVSKLLEDLTETALDGIFKENAMAFYQLEQEQLMNELQQHQAAELAQPNAEEMALSQ